MLRKIGNEINRQWGSNSQSFAQSRTIKLRDHKTYLNTVTT